MLMYGVTCISNLLHSRYANHAKNKIAGRIIPFLVLDFWDKNTGVGMRRRHAISPGCSDHYQDLGILSLKRHDSAVCNLTLSVESILCHSEILGSRTSEACHSRMVPEHGSA